MHDIIIQILKSNESIYNKKEKMAWTGAIIYLIFPILIIILLITANPTQLIKFQNNIAFNILVIAGFIFIYFTALSFVSIQFKMRWKSADVSTVIRRYLFNIKPGFELYEFQNNLNPITNESDSYLPRKLELVVRKLSFQRNTVNLLKALIQSLLIYGIFSPNIDDRFKSEIPAYISMTLCFIIQLLFYFQIVILS